MYFLSIAEMMWAGLRCSSDRLIIIMNTNEAMILRVCSLLQSVL